MKLPKHVVLSIGHNDHLSIYQTAKEWIANEEMFENPLQFKDAKARQRCIDTDEIWEIFWHPETPCGSHRAVAPTLEEALELANEVGAGQ